MGGFPNTALPWQGGANGADVSLPGSTTTTILTTSSLGAGKWLCCFSAVVNSGMPNTSIELQAALGTATATFTGETAGQSVLSGMTSYATIEITFIANVTAAGTLIFQANPSNAATAHYNTNVQGWTGTTRWTAVKIA